MLGEIDLSKLRYGN